VAQSKSQADQLLADTKGEIERHRAAAQREVDDLSYEEIALQTGISIGTVRSRLSRARARLKEVLRPQLGVVVAA